MNNLRNGTPTPGAQFVESVLRDCFAAKRFGVNRFWIYAKVEQLGIKR